jgi:two-component system, chemotaxis family, protein-glutamate methylesterase/glutaminase
MPDPARLLVVDDSRIFRTALAEALAGRLEVAVVGSVFSGPKALEFIKTTTPDVITLDIEMPGMNGLEVLEAVKRHNATLPKSAEIGVIMVSAFTRHGADVTVQALEAGAFDFITKPGRDSGAESLAALRVELIEKIQLYIARRTRVASAPAVPTAVSTLSQIRRGLGSIVLTRPARAVLIATSTGGPRALDALLPDLTTRITIPILIVQHMPPEFTRSLAASLGRLCQGRVVEARDGDPVEPQTTYIAPGGKHMVLRAGNGGLVTGITEQPPENGCRPSADVLFRSAAAAVGGEVLVAVLTGMGSDGTAGLKILKRAGAHVIAQDEATSVVWGMPGSAVAAGVVDEVLPLNQIAPVIQLLVGGPGAK